MEQTALIREATAVDAKDVYERCTELAAFLGEPESVTNTVADFESAFADGLFTADVAVVGDEVVGTAVYFDAYSTWRGPVLFLEDLLVVERFRGQGIGRQLFLAFLDRAKRGGYASAKWQVVKTNVPALKLYEQYEPSIDDRLTATLTREQVEKYSKA